MKPPAPTLAARTALAALSLYWLVMFAATHAPPGNAPHAPGNDKLHHFAAYFLLAGLLHAVCLTRGMAPRKSAVVVMAVAMAYGAFDEITQPLVGRTAELADWVADTIGAAVATAIVLAARRFASTRQGG